MSSKKNCGKTYYKYELISKDGDSISITTAKKFYKCKMEKIKKDDFEPLKFAGKKAEYNSSEDDDFEPLKFAGKINLS